MAQKGLIKKPRFASKKIRAHIKGKSKLDETWLPITEIDGYDEGAGVLEFCADHDASREVIDDLIGNIGASFLYAVTAGISDDVDVREWAEKKRRILFTSDNDYLDDNNNHPLEDCCGIIVIAQPSDANKLLSIVQMTTSVLADLVQNVALEWWDGARMRVGIHECRLWKQVGDERFCIEFRPSRDGALHFRLCK